MKKVTTAVFDEKDVGLIKRYLPDSPCISCSAGAGCVGCPAHRQWQKAYEAPLKSAGVLEYAEQYNQCARSFRECLYKLNSEYKNLLNLKNELGEIAPKVLQELVDASIPLIADLSNKYSKLKQELQEGTEANVQKAMPNLSKDAEETEAEKAETINLFT